MKNTKCKHGVYAGCVSCMDEAKDFIMNSLRSSSFSKKDDPTPIFRGCPNQGMNCFCTGRCKEVIGYL